MSSRKFRFVSPGVFLKEIDNSKIPAQADAVGPVIIGRTNKGPAMKPQKVRSLEELEIMFGVPSPGGSLDPWREGTGLLADTHAIHAAQAYLTAGAGTDSPVTMIRLLGIAGDDASPGTAGEPGWTATKAWGLFLLDKPEAAGNSIELELAGIFYGTHSDLAIKLSGTDVSTGAATHADGVDEHPVEFDAAQNINFHIHASSARKRAVKTLFNDIRKDFNTNPVSTNTFISETIPGTLSEEYWLGETFEQAFNKFDAGLTGTRAAVILELDSGTGKMTDFQSGQHGALAGRSGWVTGQDSSKSNKDFSLDTQQKLFRILALHEGQQSSQELVIGIEDIVLPRTGEVNPYGSFSVVVRKITPTGLVELERFSGCNLNPTSPDFVARQIGDQEVTWDPTEKRNKLYGEHPNVSSYIRVEMKQEIVTQGGPINKGTVPFGFYGPVRPKNITGTVTQTAAAKAQATITIAATPDKAPLEGKTITITEHTGGQTYTFTIDVNKTQAQAAAADAGQNRFIGLDQVADTDEAIGARFLAAINAARPGLNIDVASSAVVDGKTVITVVQATTGPKANMIVAGAGMPATVAVAQTVAGSNLIVHTQPAIDSWVKDNLDLTNILDSNGDTYTIKWPAMPVINKGVANHDYRMGVSPYTLSYDSNGIATDGTAIDPGWVDNLRRMSSRSEYAGHQESGNADSSNTEYSFKFSLDEVILEPVNGKTTSQITGPGDVTRVEFKVGSKTTGNNGADAPGATTHSYSSHVAAGTGKLRTLLKVVNGFQMPLDGGCDGVNIVESDPFNERVLEANSTKTSYAFASVDRALELIKDPEAIEHNIACLPGISNRTLARKLVDTCETRADSLAIIDIPGIYVPPSERVKATFAKRLTTTPEEAANDLAAEQLNSSYGCTYYPWVKIKDVDNNRDVWAPPSVVALGVMANTERSAEVWFAPAGFNRGGLNQGNAGVPVLQVTEQLLAKDRDTLYQSNINPIASFVSEGIVIFGQKTLQSTQSALDRINVRRLLIFVKKEVSRISKNLLFEQNVQATWARFHGQVKPFLESVKVRFGLTDFKVVLDSTTTTADLVDRNIMYAKIFLKPARSIEFIAVDFVITRSGASFADPLE